MREIQSGSDGRDPVEYTWYVRDAQDNVMAVYNSQGTGTGYGNYNLLLKEQHLYGSSRLGMLKRNVDVKSLSPHQPVMAGQEATGSLR